MNKKLLFAAMSLAAFTACTNDDFESQKVAEETSPIQFELINDDVTRASMDGNKIVWNANDGDLFTLYHGSVLGAVTGFENATYKANANEGGNATLTTPSMIKAGGAVMVWPVDSTFRIGSGANLTIKISTPQTNIENNIPYMSDLIDIEAYAAYSETAAPGVIPTAYKTAGLGRKYVVYMRPMASQLIVKADYAGTDNTLASLYTGDDPIEQIRVSSVDLLTQTGGTTLFTTEVPVKFSAPAAATTTAWNNASSIHKWNMVTDFDVANITAAGQTDKLTTTCLTGNESSKFLILPQAQMTTDGSGVAQAGVVVNTIYGKVVVAANGVHNSAYTAAEYADAWYRFVSNRPATEADGETTATTKETAGDGAGKYKTTANVEMGMKQTLNGLSSYTATAGTVIGEPIGAATTRYVKVLLSHLDMSDLHIKTDKQLRDVVRVWKKMALPAVTVFLDGDANNEFKISQKTIETINTINNGALNFKVKPCQTAGEVCNTIVVTGADYKQDIQDIAFIAANGLVQADVAFDNETTAWKWNGVVKVTDAGVQNIINRGTMENAATATLQTKENNNTQNNIPFINNGTWDITAGTLNVQFDVTNNGTVNISKGAQYRQDGRINGTNTVLTFTNDATNKPSRFGGNDSKIGVVNNYGVFATVASGEIANYGLIEHADVDAKTYITSNQIGGTFTSAFNATTNKMGRINLPFSNKNEDNVSVSAALNQGFISVTVDGEVSGALDASVVGSKVNYVIVKSGITEIKAVSAQVKYLEINQPGTEIAWNVTTATNYTGLMVLSDVNIKLGTTINATVTYLGADMYVGGTFNNGTTSWSGYYGDTSGNVATKYITY